MCLPNALGVRGAQSATVNTVSVASRAQAANCGVRKAVARAIYVLLKKQGFSKLELSRINVSYDAGTKVVTLRGFASPNTRKKSQKMVRVNLAGKLAADATTCETSVDNQLTPKKTPNCPPGKKECSNTGLCIPEGEECNAGTMP